MPLAREQQEYVAGLDWDILHMLRGKHALALDQIKHLIFIERAAALDVEIIAVAVPVGGICVVGTYLVVPYGVDDEPPLGVALRCHQICAVLHFCS